MTDYPRDEHHIKMIRQGPHTSLSIAYRKKEAERRRIEREKVESERFSTDEIQAVDGIYDKKDTTMDTRGPNVQRWDRNDAKLNEDALKHANRRQNGLRGGLVTSVAFALIIGACLGILGTVTCYASKVNADILAIDDANGIEIVPVEQILIEPPDDSPPAALSTSEVEGAVCEQPYVYQDVRVTFYTPGEGFYETNQVCRGETVSTWVDRATEMGLDGICAAGGQTNTLHDFYQAAKNADPPWILQVGNLGRFLLVDRASPELNRIDIWQPVPPDGWQDFYNVWRVVEEEDTE